MQKGLSINVVRPSDVKADSKLPVAVVCMMMQRNVFHAYHDSQFVLGGKQQFVLFLVVLITSGRRI